MKRKIIDQLINWKNKKNKKPVLLTGAKGVGKTYLSYDFAKAFFEQIDYINFEREPLLASMLEGNLIHIKDSFQSYFKLERDALNKNRILILDEISFPQPNVESLSMLQNSGLYQNIILISSIPLPEVSLKDFYHITLHPLDFDEFLLATANDWYIDAIKTHFESNKKVPDIVHNELLMLHQLYLQIGGMPGAINEYLNLSSLINIPEQHNLLLGSYRDYIHKSHTESDALKMNQVLDSLVLQLMKENKKFQYKLIRKGTTHAMYRDAIQELADSSYVIKCNKLQNNLLEAPLKAFKATQDSNSFFKLYMPDTGLLYSKITEEAGCPLDLQTKKAVLENYIAQSLYSKGYSFMFWESDSMAKIDFVYLKGDHLFALELFEGENTRSKSMNVFNQKCEISNGIKISSKNFEYTNQIKFIPYYAVFCL